MNETREQIYYDNGGIKVTNARFIVPSQTYAMSGITSVKFHAEKPKLLWSLLAFFFGLMMLVRGDNIWAVIVPIALGVAIFFVAKKYHVVLSSASGETRALVSTDKKMIVQVIEGLNNAIIARG